MTRRRTGGLASIVDDSAHIANGFGPLGAVAVGATGFALFYAAIPASLEWWLHINVERLRGPAAAAMATALSQVFQHRFVEPMQWVGTAILLVSLGVALCKLLAQPLGSHDLGLLSGIAKLLSRWMCR